MSADSERIEAIMTLVDEYTDHFHDAASPGGGPLFAEGLVLKARKDRIRAALAALASAAPAGEPMASIEKMRKALEAAQEVVDGVPQWHNAGHAARLIQDALASPLPLPAEPAELPPLPDVDEFAQHIRWLNGNNKMDAGALAEKLLEWMRSRAGVSAAPNPAPVDPVAAPIEPPGAAGGAVAQLPPNLAWRDHSAAIDAKALATATEIALMWGQDRSQFVSRIQVAVTDAMLWLKPALRAAPSTGAAIGSEQDALKVGARVRTADGEGTICVITPATEAKYHVHLGKGYGDVYYASQLRLVAAMAAAPGEQA